MSFSIIVYTKDASLKAKLEDFYKNRKERVIYEENCMTVLLQLVKGEGNALFLDIDNNKENCITLIDIINRMYKKLPIVVFNKFKSLEEWRILKKSGVFFSTMKPVQLSIIKEVTESIKSIKYKKTLIMGGPMRSLNIALVLTNNNKLRESFSYLFNQMEISYIFESKELNGLLRIMSLPLKSVFIEVNPYDSNGLNFITLVRKLKPQLKIIAVSEYSSENDKIIEAGADHCFQRSVLEESKESIVDKFNVLMEKQNHLEKNEI